MKLNMKLVVVHAIIHCLGSKILAKRKVAPEETREWKKQYEKD
jgi:hypothetical protein